MSLHDEDELLAKQRKEFRSHQISGGDDSSDSIQPLPIAKDSGFIETKYTAEGVPSPQVAGGNAGGAIAAGVVSVLIVILLGNLKSWKSHSISWMLDSQIEIDALIVEQTSTKYKF